MTKPGPTARPVFDRFIEKTEPGENGCIVWTASGNGAGYGAMYIAKGKRVLAHRWSYEYYVGPIPDGLVLDHLCRNPKCVNPEHLEAVTQRVNTLRGKAPTAINAAKTHCLLGHEYTPENTLIRNGKRSCRVCKNAANKAYHQNNLEVVRARSRDYYYRNREQRIASNTERRRQKNAKAKAESEAT